LLDFSCKTRLCGTTLRRCLGIQLTQLHLFALGGLEVRHADTDEPDLSSVFLEFAKEQDDVISDNAKIINVASVGLIASKCHEPLKPDFDAYGTVEQALAEKPVMNLVAQ